MTDPVITTLRIAAALIGFAGTLTTSIALLAGTISIGLALVSLFAFAVMGAAFVLGD